MGFCNKAFPEGREFCLTINRVFMAEFLTKIHEEYAKKNGTPNILSFELEAYKNNLQINVDLVFVL